LIKPDSVVKDALKPNDHVVVSNLESDDIWLKFKITMNWAANGDVKERTLESELELKIDKALTGQSF
jgi:hypothetical protein